jgi:hypothetical protein
VNITWTTFQRKENNILLSLTNYCQNIELTYTQEQQQSGLWYRHPWQAWNAQTCYHPGDWRYWPTRQTSTLKSWNRYLSFLVIKLKRFNTANKFCQWKWSWDSLIHLPSSLQISPRSILILSFHLILCLPSGRFYKGFPTKLRSSCLPVQATCTIHHNLPDFTILMILDDLYKSGSPLLYTVISLTAKDTSFIGPNIFTEIYILYSVF